MTDLVVAKFGGTSVADFDAMNRSVDVARLDENTRVVVLSASAGVTNLLVALAEGLEPAERFEKLESLRQIQFNILERLRYPNVIREEIERLLENITTLAEAAALASSAALTDELVSHGELMSTLLFVEILRERGIASQWFDVRKIMRTNDRFGRAEPDIAALAELTQLQLTPRLAEGLVVTQGFIGSEAKGRTTTLGRGGSDYTAALLGEALNASRVDIWTDVPGIYTTDPRVAPAAKRIDVIAFEEAAEMATFGAKVLHPATLLPAVRSDIPVFVGSSKEPKPAERWCAKNRKSAAVPRAGPAPPPDAADAAQPEYAALPRLPGGSVRHSGAPQYLRGSDHHLRSERGVDHGYHRFDLRHRYPADPGAADRALLAVPRGSGRIWRWWR
jgi:aspartate kinase